MAQDLEQDIAGIVGIDPDIVHKFVSILDADGILLLRNLVNERKIELLRRIFTNGDHKSMVPQMVESVLSLNDDVSAIGLIPPTLWYDADINNGHLVALAQVSNAPFEMLTAGHPIKDVIYEHIRIMVGSSPIAPNDDTNLPYQVNADNALDAILTVLDANGVEWQMIDDSRVGFGSNAAAILALASMIQSPAPCSCMGTDDKYQNTQPIDNYYPTYEEENIVAKQPIVNESSFMSPVSDNGFAVAKKPTDQFDRLAHLAGVTPQQDASTPTMEDAYSDVATNAYSDDLPVLNNEPPMPVDVPAEADVDTIGKIQHLSDEIREQMGYLKIMEYRAALGILEELVNSAKLFGMDNLRYGA